MLLEELRRAGGAFGDEGGKGLVAIFTVLGCGNIFGVRAETRWIRRVTSGQQHGQHGDETFHMRDRIMMDVGLANFVR